MKRLVASASIFLALGAVATADCAGCAALAPSISSGSGPGPQIQITFNFGADGECGELVGSGCGQVFACEFSYDVELSGAGSGFTETLSSRTYNALLLNPPPFRDGEPSEAENGTTNYAIDVGCNLKTDRIHELFDASGNLVDIAGITLRCQQCFTAP